MSQGFPGLRFSGRGWSPQHSQSRRATNCATPRKFNLLVRVIRLELWIQSNRKQPKKLVKLIFKVGTQLVKSSKKQPLEKTSNSRNHCSASVCWFFRALRFLLLFHLPKLARCQLRYTRMIIKPHHIISFWGDFVKDFQLWSNKWSKHFGKRNGIKPQPANPCAARVLGI